MKKTTKIAKIARYLVVNDVEIETADMKAICANFGAKYEAIKDQLVEAYDMAMTELGVF